MEKYIIKILVLGLIAMSVSCSIDDIQPEGRLDALNAVTNESTAKNVLNRVYNSYRTSSNYVMAVGTMYAGVEANTSANSLSGLNGFGANNYQESLTSILDGFYKDKYYTINTANYLIDQLEAGKATDLESDDKLSVKNEILAEARVLRAFARFELLRIFGQFYDASSQYGIIIEDKPISSNVKNRRATVQESYASIIKDLEFGTVNAAPSKQHYYVTQAFAQALLAKVYLYQKEYAKAAINAAAVISNPEFALEPSYSGIYSNRFQSTEVLFAPFVAGNDNNPSVSDYGYFTTYEFTLSPDLMTLADLQVDDVDSLRPSYDPRYAFVTDTSGHGFLLADPKYNKYPYEDRSFDPNDKSGNTFYYLRNAEMYLIYAEAEARRGGDTDDAVAKLNAIRTRAGVTPKSYANFDLDTFLVDVRHEKLLELFVENGEPWFDLVRYNFKNNLTATDLKSTLVDARLIFPIPTRLLGGNDKLIQNPGYN